MKKILFFLPNLAGGGAERVAVNIIRQLDKVDFSISLVLVNRSGKYLDLIPEHVKVYDLESKKTILSIFKLRRLLIHIQPNIVFSTLIRTHVALNLAMTHTAHRPFIILRSPNSPSLLLSNKQLKPLLRYFLERAYLNADVVIAQTPEMKEEIVKFHAVDEMKVEVLINPIDTNFIDSKLENISNPFDEKNINVVAAGRLTKQKGFDVLIKAFADVVKYDDRFKLHIIGADDGESKFLNELCEVLNLENHINFLGFKQNPYRYFFYSDLYVLSSRWEGLPNTVLENLYIKKPVIATKCIPFMNVLINHGKNGLLVDVEDISGLEKAILKYKDIREKGFVNMNKNNINDKFLRFINIHKGSK